MVAAGFVIAVAIIYFLYEPQQNSFFLFCPLHHFTGLKCPFCGLQQMIHHLLHGQIGRAFFDNPFLFILIPYVLFHLYLSIFRKKDRFPKLYNLLYGDRTLLFLLGVAVVFGVGRNLWG